MRQLYRLRCRRAVGCVICGGDRRRRGLAVSCCCSCGSPSVWQHEWSHCVIVAGVECLFHDKEAKDKVRINKKKCQAQTFPCFVCIYHLKWRNLTMCVCHRTILIRVTNRISRTAIRVSHSNREDATWMSMCYVDHRICVTCNIELQMSFISSFLLLKYMSFKACSHHCQSWQRPWRKIYDHW